jgi:hypothetical protein
MGLGRYKTVPENEEGIYHCFVRCVRRAFLYGYDAVTNQDYSHRKAWILDRMRFLAGIFAIDVCAYAILSNHYLCGAPHKKLGFYRKRPHERKLIKAQMWRALSIESC